MKRARDFPLDVQSVGAARRFADEVLTDVPTDVLESVELMVSELATNSIRHARTGFHLTIVQQPATVRVEVTDQGGGTPAVQSPGPTDPRGRGLAIVETVSDAWGVEYAASEDKTVWFTLGWSPSTAGAGQPRHAHVAANQTAGGSGAVARMQHACATCTARPR